MLNRRYVLDQSLGEEAFGFDPTAVENAQFMSRVYASMTGGLLLTGAVAWNVAGGPRLVRRNMR